MNYFNLSIVLIDMESKLDFRPIGAPIRPEHGGFRRFITIFTYNKFDILVVDDDYIDGI